MKFAWIAATTSLLLASGAAAESLELPLGAKFCEDRSAVEFAMEAPQELADDVIESTASLWGFEGFATATFDENRLIILRVRIFDEADAMARIRAKLEAQFGAGGESARKTHWAPSGSTKVSLRLQSEQIYVTYEIEPAGCGEIAREAAGLTDQEKADLEAVSHKQAIGFDPYEDVDDTEPVIKKKEEEAKAEEVTKEDEESEETPADVDIDW